MLTDTFTMAYKKLNPAQKKTVDAIDGPVMVIAGPGTGKTTILTLRIANILRKTDTTPDCILALTFTEAGVYSMRKKLVEIIGSPAYKVNIFTFHGFCNEVIKNFPEEFPRIIGSINITEIDQIKIMEEIISVAKLANLKPYGAPFYYLHSVLREIQNFKRDDIDPDEFAELIESQEKKFKNIDDLYNESGKYKGKIKTKYERLAKEMKKNKELLTLYRSYQKELENRKLYDYDDMIMEVVCALQKNKNLLLELQEKYQYILADEHQDANNSQNKLLEFLANFHDSPNLFIVGDEKQAIYRFQGASLENFLYFKRLYPKATVINLEENYRSSQTILDASHSLIGNNKIEDSKLRVELKANGKHENKKISLYEFEKQDFEYAFLVKDIAEKIKNKIPAREIAVLYRNNKDALAIIDAFRKTGIPFSVISDMDIFSDEDISKLVRLFRSINDLNDQELLAEVLFIDFFNIFNLDVYKILAYRSKERLLLQDIIRSENLLKNAGVSKPRDFIEFSKKIEYWNRLAKNKGLAEFFETTVRESGFLSHILALSGSLDKLGILDDLFSEIKKIIEGNKNARLADFISYLDILKKHDVLVKRKGFGVSREAVSLMTAHKSKGLEFEFVYIVGAVDGKFGNQRGRENFHIPRKDVDELAEHKIDDERRLFYVAITRAKKHVSISYSKQNADGKECVVSEFVTEIDPKFVEKVDVSKSEEQFKNINIEKFSAKKNNGVDIKEKGYLKNLFLEQGLSVSALNAYLKCPWQYFFNNLLRIPATQDKWALYGTAVHGALKEFFDKYRAEKDMTKSELISAFQHYLSRQPLSEKDFEESLAKGKKALAGYYDFYKNKWNRNILTEFSVAEFIEFSSLVRHSGESRNPELENQKILLKGKLDKLEFGSEVNPVRSPTRGVSAVASWRQTSNGVNVVDYKTGGQKSRNEIEGKTKTSDGNYKRQLIFYKLLLDNYEKGKYKMESGEIDFIEPDARGKFRKEKFYITDEEVAELSEQIKKVASEILTFSFWDKTCDDRECEWCELKKALGIRH